eukprot:3126761-Karenia_brevis.AAC.1
MSSVMAKKRYKGKIHKIRWSIDCKAILDRILSQSIAHAKTDGWALETVLCVVDCNRSHVFSKTLAGSEQRNWFLAGEHYCFTK